MCEQILCRVPKINICFTLTWDHALQYTHTHTQPNERRKTEEEIMNGKQIKRKIHHNVRVWLTSYAIAKTFTTCKRDKRVKSTNKKETPYYTVYKKTPTLWKTQGWKKKIRLQTIIASNLFISFAFCVCVCACVRTHYKSEQNLFFYVWMLALVPATRMGNKNLISPLQ